MVGTQSSQRPLSRHSSPGCNAGMSISCAPVASISSRTICSTFASTFCPRGRNAYTPDAVLRIMPARMSRR